MYSTNTENIQVKTKGWKLVHTQTVSGVTLNVYSDGIIAEYFFKGDVTVTGNSLVLNFNTNYAPIAFIIAPLMQWDYCRLAYDGNLTITKINTTSNSLHVQTGFTGILKTPLY